MGNFSIGVILDSFRKPFPEAMDIAQKLGVQGIQVYAVQGEMAPENLVGQKRRDFLKAVKDHGLVISALCGDMGVHFDDPARNPAYIERSKRILDLAKELETNIVTTHVGAIPGDPVREGYAALQDACGQMAAYADSLDAHFAIETGTETSDILRQFLDGLHSTGVAVNLDPANLVMCAGDDPVKAVHNLAPYIVHTHAKDGIMYWPYTDDPAAHQGPPYVEMPLGKGNVSFVPYLAALKEIGYNGFLTIEREVGDDPTADIAMAVNFLKERI